MKRQSNFQAENLINARKKRGHLRRGIALLSALVLLITVYALKMNADTLERTPMCGLEEHVHTAACYPLVCGLEESEPVYETQRVYIGGFEAHRHTADCLDDEGNLACGYVEGEYWHTHNRWCYDDSGKLVCGLKERKPHEHTDACYEDVATLACGLEETAGHEHTDACYTQRQELTCGQMEYEGHVHTDACYNDYDELTCGKEESKGHQHTDACYDEKKGLTCGQEESAGHQHTDDCYVEFTQQTCNQVEGPGHQHNEDCYRLELICDQLETDEHQHTDDCYEQVLVCGMEAGEGAHTHTDDCFITTRELVCGMEAGEGAHTHTDACYTTTRELTCGKKAGQGAHEHTKDCYTHHHDLVCGMEAGEGAHTHTDDCYTTYDELSCGMEAGEGAHTHTEDCYVHESRLVCGKDEAERIAAKLGVDSVSLHTHTDKCFTTVTRVVNGEKRQVRLATCGYLEVPTFVSGDGDWSDVLTLASAGHTHTDACYDLTADPICGLPEHEHTDACYQQRPAAKPVEEDAEESVETPVEESAEEDIVESDGETPVESVEESAEEIIETIAENDVETADAEEITVPEEQSDEVTEALDVPDAESQPDEMPGGLDALDSDAQPGEVTGTLDAIAPEAEPDEVTDTLNEISSDGLPVAEIPEEHEEEAPAAEIEEEKEEAPAGEAAQPSVEEAEPETVAEAQQPAADTGNEDETAVEEQQPAGDIATEDESAVGEEQPAAIIENEDGSADEARTETIENEDETAVEERQPVEVIPETDEETFEDRQELETTAEEGEAEAEAEPEAETEAAPEAEEIEEAPVEEQGESETEAEPEAEEIEEAPVEEQGESETEAEPEAEEIEEAPVEEQGESEPEIESEPVANEDQIAEEPSDEQGEDEIESEIEAAPEDDIEAPVEEQGETGTEAESEPEDESETETEEDQAKEAAAGEQEVTETETESEAEAESEARQTVEETVDAEGEGSTDEQSEEPAGAEGEESTEEQGEAPADAEDEESADTEDEETAEERGEEPADAEDEETADAEDEEPIDEQGEEPADMEDEESIDAEDEASAEAPVEEETRSASVTVDLSSVDLMDAATIQGKTVKLSVSDLLEAKDDAVSVEGDLDIDHREFAENAEVISSDNVRVADGVITLPVKALDKGAVSLQMQTEQTDEDDNVTAVTTQTVDIELNGYTGRTGAVSEENIELTTDRSTSLPADATVTLTENPDVPEGILDGDAAQSAGTVEGALAYDITITNSNEDEISDTGTVSVTVSTPGVNVYEDVPSGATVKEVRYTLYHSHDGGEPVEVPNVQVDMDDDGNVTGFSFETDSFSTYILKYTVDFEYTDPETGETFKWSFPGQGSYKLSTIMAVLGVNADIESARLELIEGNLVEGALYLETIGEEQYLNSDVPFRDTYELTVVAGGKAYAIRVTDASQTTNLNDLLQNIDIKNDSNESVIEDGKRIVVDFEKSYEFLFSFKETSSLQYSNDNELVYSVPDGVDLETTSPVQFDIDIGGRVITGNTYQVVEVNGKKEIHINFNKSHYNYAFLDASQDVEIDLSFRGKITEQFTANNLTFGAEASGYSVENKKVCNAEVKKTGYYDANTQKMHYTVYVAATEGNPTNVSVKDTITGTALKFDQITRIVECGAVATWEEGTIYYSVNEWERSSDNYTAGDGITVNNAAKGGKELDLTIASIPEGRAVKIEYTADVDFSQIALNNNATVEETGNGVTIKAEGDDTPDDNVDKHEEKYINFSSISKVATAVGEIVDEASNPWTDSSTGKKYRVVTWKVTANTEGKVSLKGSAITDTLLNNSEVEYYGDGLSVKKALADGNAIDWAGITATEVSWASVGVSNKAADGGWSYTVNDDGNYAYEITYQTRVDITGLAADASKEVVNAAKDKYDEDTGRVTIKSEPENKPSITKNATSVSKEYTTWKISVDIPANWHGPLVVKDTLPNQGDYYDEIVSIAVDGYTKGTTAGNGYYTEAITAGYRVSHYEEGTGQAIYERVGDASFELNFGEIQSSASNRTINITVVTKNNADWVAASEMEDGSWMINHTNTVNASDGGETQYGTDSDTVQPKTRILTKTASAASEFEYYKGPDQYNNPSWYDEKGMIFPFYVRIVGATTSNVDITETFNTDLFEIYEGDGRIGYDAYSDRQTIYYNNNANNLGNEADHKATITKTSTGAVIHLTDLPRTEGNALYSYYTVRYYLVVKFGKMDDFKAYVAQHGTPIVDGNGNVIGKTYAFTNNADWDGISDSEEFSYSISNVINKTSYQDSDGNYVYTITLNPDKLKVNNGRPYELSDVFSGMTVAKDTISITTDPSGKSMHIYGTAAEALNATEDIVVIHDANGSISVMVPDQTKVIMTYKGVPTGAVSVDEAKKLAVSRELNEATALDYHYKVDYTHEHEVISKTKKENDDGTITFTIELNKDKVALKNGEDYDLTDTFSGLTIDDADSNFVVTCDPDVGGTKAAAILSSKALTSTGTDSGSYTFTIPDSTHVIIKYTGRPTYTLDTETGDISANYTNTATADNIPSDVPGTVEEKVLTKTAGALISDGTNQYNGQIPFTIVFNPTAEELNEGKDIEMKDAFTNLIVEYSSIHLTPAFYPSWHEKAGQPIVVDYSGNVGTFMIPDRTKITLTYYAKPDFSQGESVAWSNKVTCKGYSSQTGRTETRETSGLGHGTLPHSLYLFKYETGHMERPLNGVTFKLYMDVSGTKTPVTDKSGHQVTFTTENYTNKGDGYQLMLLNKDDIADQFVDETVGGFKADTIYYLEEDGTVDGYYPNTTTYNFVWHSNTKPDPEDPTKTVTNEPYEKPAYMTGQRVYVFGQDETVKVTNDKITQAVAIRKYWVNGDGTWDWPEDIDKVTVKLQQKLGDEDWKDISVENGNIPSYYWNKDSHAVVAGADGSTWSSTLDLTANASAGAWSNLDLKVTVDGVEADATYRVVEVSVTSDGTTANIVDGKVTVNGKTYDVMGGAVKNGSTSVTNAEETSVEFEKQWTVPANVTFAVPAGATVVATGRLNNDRLTVSKSELIVVARLHRYVVQGGDKLATYDYAEDDLTAIAELTGDSWTKTWDNLPTAFLDADGNEVDYVYEVEEAMVTVPTSIMHDGSSGYVDIKDIFTATASTDGNGRQIITNTLTDDDSYYLNVTKDWLDSDGHATTGEAVEFQLVRNGSRTTVNGTSNSNDINAILYIANSWYTAALDVDNTSKNYNNANITIPAGKYLEVVVSTDIPGNVQLSEMPYLIAYDWTDGWNRGQIATYTPVQSGNKFVYRIDTSNIIVSNIKIETYGLKVVQDIDNGNAVYPWYVKLNYKDYTTTSSISGQVLRPIDESDYTQGYEVDATGDYKFTIHPNETISFPNLPYHVVNGSTTEEYSYTVVETSTGSDWNVVTGEGAYNPAPTAGQTGGQNGSVTLVNQYDRPKTGSITIDKTMRYNGKADTAASTVGKTFRFKLYSNAEGTVLAKDADGQTVPEQQLTIGADGKATATIENLLYGTYYLYEQGDGGNITDGSGVMYGTTYQVSGTGTVALNGATHTVEVTNEETETGSVSVMKEVRKNGAKLSNAGNAGPFYAALYLVDGSTETFVEQMTLTAANTADYTKALKFTSELTVGATYKVYELKSPLTDTTSAAEKAEKILNSDDKLAGSGTIEYKVTYNNQTPAIVRGSQKDQTATVYNDEQRTELYVQKRFTTGSYDQWVDTFTDAAAAQPIIYFKLYRNGVWVDKTGAPVTDQTAKDDKILKLLYSDVLKAPANETIRVNRDGVAQDANYVKDVTEIHWIRYFPNLPGANALEYSVVECTSDGEDYKLDRDYKTCLEFGNTGIAIKNELTSYTVEKTWEDISAGHESYVVELQLYRDGKAYGDPVTAARGEDGKWTYTWNNLLAFDPETSATYAYHAEETHVYDSADTDTRDDVTEIFEATQDDGTTHKIVNKPVLTELHVTKVWHDAGDAAVKWHNDGKAELIFTLTRKSTVGGVSVTQEVGALAASAKDGTGKVTFVAENDFTAELKDVTAALTLPEGTSYGDGYVISLTNLPKLTTVNGKLCIWTYELQETELPSGYRVSYYKSQAEIAAKQHKNGEENAKDGEFIVNTPITYTLPATGGTGTTIFTVVGASLMLLAVLGFILLNRKRTDGDGIR